MKGELEERGREWKMEGVKERGEREIERYREREGKWKMKGER